MRNPPPRSRHLGRLLNRAGDLRLTRAGPEPSRPSLSLHAPKNRPPPSCHKAALDMAAKGCGAAAFDRPHGAPPRRRQRRANASASHEKARVHGRSIFGQGFERIKAVIMASASTPANASLPGSWRPHSTRSSTNAWRSDSQCVRRRAARTCCCRPGPTFSTAISTSLSVVVTPPSDRTQRTPCPRFVMGSIVPASGAHAAPTRRSRQLVHPQSTGSQR
jgi:hypothetical protein